MRFVLPMLAIVLAPAMAFAQVAAVPPEGFDLIKPMMEAASGGHWSVFASLVIMALVFLATKVPLLQDFIKGEAKIWVSVSAGVLSAVAMEAFTSGDWVRAILSGAATGFAAGGLADLISRRAAGKPLDADGDGKLDPK